MMNVKGNMRQHESPFKRFRFITQQLCASENEKSKSDSESSMNYKLQLQILKKYKCKNIEVKKKEMSF